MKQIFLFLTILSILSATTINIPSDYTTIQEGIDVSVDGDTNGLGLGQYGYYCW
jgi:hypothetical protein